MALRQHHAQLGTSQAAPPVKVAAAAAAPVALKAAPPAVAPAPASVTAPAPAAARPATQAADPTPLVASRLEAWRQAWEAKDASRYLAFYGSNCACRQARPQRLGRLIAA